MKDDSMLYGIVTCDPVDKAGRYFIVEDISYMIHAGDLNLICIIKCA